MALANHRKAIRAEIARYAERFRAAQLEAVTAALRTIGVTDEELPPVVALLLMTGLSQVLALEDALGVTAGHETTTSFIARTIAAVRSGVAGYLTRVWASALSPDAGRSRQTARARRDWRATPRSPRWPPVLRRGSA